MTKPNLKLKTQNSKLRYASHVLNIFKFLVLSCSFAFLALNFEFALALSRTPLSPEAISPPLTVITDESFSFVVFGDNRDGDEIFMDLIEKVNQEEDISFAVNTGDLVPYGREKEYINYLRMASQLKVKLYNVSGNHDLVGFGYKYYKKYFGTYYYSFDYGNSHFVVLNNAFAKSFDAQQFEWLKKDLAKTKKENIFVFMHRPTFDPTEIYKNHIMSGRETIKQLMRVFKRYKVDYVIAGHIHGYGRAKRDGIVFIVTGGAGAPLYLPKDFGGFYHYVKVKVDGGKIADEVVRIYE